MPIDKRWYMMYKNFKVNEWAVVFVKDGQSRIVVKRETLEDIIRNDI
jgi:diaminopimelate decarboxylase